MLALCFRKMKEFEATLEAWKPFRELGLGERWIRG